MGINRIVSLAPSNTEVIFALGEGGKLVGVTEFCNYPPEARLIEKIGGFSTPNIEKIISLSPDLVLATNLHLKTPVVSQLKNRGINIYIIEENTLLDTSQAIMLIGGIIGREKEARQLARDIQIQINKIASQTKHLMPDERPNVCYICSNNPLRIARGPCCVNKFIEIAGGINIGAVILKDESVSLKTIADINPDVIIVSTGHGEIVDLLGYVKNESILHKTGAYKNNRVYQAGADLFTRFGPRVIDGLGMFAKLIHPEIFSEAKIG